MRSFLLMITKATPIAKTTNPPATRLDKNPDNEVVIFNSVFFYKLIFIKSTTILII